MSAITLVRHHRAGLRRRHPLRAVLLRAAAGDDHPVGDARAVLPPGAGVHGLRVPGAPLRCPDARADEPSVPGVARSRRGRDHCGAGRHPLHRARLEPAPHRPGHRHPDDALHDAGRRTGGDLGRRQADGGDHGRGDRRGDRPDPRPARGDEPRAGAARRGRHRPAAGDRLHLRSERDLHLLVGPHRRAVPDARLLRLRSEPGPALPDRQVGGRRPAVAADERVRQDPVAGADPDDGGARLLLLPVHRAADALQHVARGGGRGERAGGRVPGARRRVPGRARRPARRCGGRG